MMEPDSVKKAVRDRYAEAARRAAIPQPPDAATPTQPGSRGTDGPSQDPITRDLYDELELSTLPHEAVRASLGCGNPTGLAELSEGETVLDLGSGGGIDVLLAARVVGPSGRVYGVDMTDEMLDIAARNKAAAGVRNVEFLKGEIEAIPMPDAAVDVIISNCVINLSTDKDRTLAEAFRVLKPGGRLAISDIVAHGHVPESLRADMASWAGCVSGALEESEYRAKLAAAGFLQIEIRVTRDLPAAELMSGSAGCACSPAADSPTKPEGGDPAAANEERSTLSGAAASTRKPLGARIVPEGPPFVSAFIHAVKPESEQ